MQRRCSTYLMHVNAAVLPNIQIIVVALPVFQAPMFRLNAGVPSNARWWAFIVKAGGWACS